MEQDRELVKRCVGGDDAAWETLLRSHTRKIFNLCYRFTGRSSEAEDLTQEVFIKVFQTLQSYDEAQGAFATWLNRVARNHLVDHYRRTKKDRVTSSLEDDAGVMVERPDSGPAPSGRVESREQREWLQAGLNQLSPDLREAVILRDLSDLDYEEIAAVLGVPQGTVKSRINRGRLELARVLKRMEGMEGQK
ncbi:MAG: RNA polymerase subunit sigma-24 [Acidobacteria bacterium]|nr:MAG: RNA polymerase subunit sigma-24 [Acidobacteriota bacterium]